MRARACFEHALNDGKVEVTYSYEWNDPDCTDIIKITHDGHDVTSIVHPDDYEYLFERCPHHAREDKADAAAEEADRRYKERREECHAA